jgi:hypothetical protein
MLICNHLNPVYEWRLGKSEPWIALVCPACNTTLEDISVAAVTDKPEELFGAEIVYTGGNWNKYYSEDEMCVCHRTKIILIVPAPNHPLLDYVTVRVCNYCDKTVEDAA